MDTAERASLNFFFASIPLSELPPEKEIFCVRSDQSISQAVALLRQKNVLAAPVLDVNAPEDAAWLDKYCGIVDMIGILFFLVDVMQQEKLRSLEKVLEHRVLDTTKVGDIAGTARWGPFVPLSMEDNMLDAMLLMGKYGLHRVPVVMSPGGDIVHFLTQSAIVDTLSRNMDQFKVLAQQTLAELGLGNKVDCFSVRTDSMLREAVLLIKEKNIGAVPVLGMNNMVVGNVSARDLRTLLLTPSMFHMLHEPIRTFLALSSSLEHEDKNPAITCRPEDTFGHVIKQLAATRIHRIYVCDKQIHLIRVLSLSDIFNVFVQEPSSDYFGKYDLMVRQ
jgi:CBS-domain-containing membrane protein